MIITKDGRIDYGSIEPEVNVQLKGA